MTLFPEGPESSPGFLLWNATLRWQRAIAAALGPLGLTHVQFVLLATTWWLSQTDRAPNQVQLSERTGSDARMTSAVIRRLEAKGLLERRPDERDSRAKIIHPTAEGIDLARRAITLVENVDHEFFSPADQPELLHTLQALAGVRTLN
ncbi:MarR family winged helix-turn-helix transcriptional regulator [Pseudarthrobacter albicanus]|uniref:MarR family winged helix-turn-helix transcriptional regulator n=1 Tax=Pseudarthrobacter albicanus TaxID=2823873 RepID=UPI001BAB75DB|nr:MarR family transcriptional regulator [Pseudarthrobacter albicanus]